MIGPENAAHETKKEPAPPPPPSVSGEAAWIKKISREGGKK